MRESEVQTVSVRPENGECKTHTPPDPKSRSEPAPSPETLTLSEEGQLRSQA